MIGIFLVICCAAFLLTYGLMLRIVYVFSIKDAIKFNTQVVVKRVPNVMFACFKEYANFKFDPDYTNIQELPEQYLVLSNHQSLLDIIAIMKYNDSSRLRFIAKKELGRFVPLVSLTLRSAKHCLIKRTGSPTQAMRAVDELAAHVKENNLVPVIFPEGTRSKDGNLGTFHAAGFRRLLNGAPMPVAVYALDGAWKVSSVKNLAKNLRGVFFKIKLLKVYDAPASKADQVKILEESKILIQKQLDEWRK